MLTPYDIIRLKQRLGISSTEFLRLYTEPFEFGKESVAGVKLKPKEGTSECQFVTDEGCSVYEDRPTACRYYPIGLLSTRRQDENFDRAAYALVKEDHCHGHFEDRKLTIDEYRKEQGLEEYDEKGRLWRQQILKVKSAGPYIGRMSMTSRKFFFMASYDVDRFREFIRSEGFQTTYDVDAGDAGPAACRRYRADGIRRSDDPPDHVCRKYYSNETGRVGDASGAAQTKPDKRRGKGRGGASEHGRLQHAARRRR